MQKEVTVVIGKSGQLAWELQQLNNDESLLFFGRNEIDITSPENIEATFGHLTIKGMINASAYTAVDKAESEPEQAFLINRDGVRNLAEFCAKHDIHLTHISTDYVFGGDKGKPYLPDDEYNPQSVYGESKMAGELAIKEVLPNNSAIVRTSWVYSSHGNNFVKTMLRLMNERDELSVVDDQIGSPTSATTLALACLNASDKKLTGVFHFSDNKKMSWQEFACAIQELGLEHNLLKSKIKINKIPSSEFPTPAARPKYSVLEQSVEFDSISNKRGDWKDELINVVRALR